jgi:hypothetical protein
MGRASGWSAAVRRAERRRPVDPASSISARAEARPAIHDGPRTVMADLTIG